MKLLARRLRRAATERVQRGRRDAVNHRAMAQIAQALTPRIQRAVQIEVPLAAADGADTLHLWQAGSGATAAVYTKRGVVSRWQLLTDGTRPAVALETVIQRCRHKLDNWQRLPEAVTHAPTQGRRRGRRPSLPALQMEVP